MLIRIRVRANRFYVIELFLIGFYMFRVAIWYIIFLTIVVLDSLRILRRWHLFFTFGTWRNCFLLLLLLCRGGRVRQTTKCPHFGPNIGGGCALKPRPKKLERATKIACPCPETTFPGYTTYVNLHYVLVLGVQLYTTI